MEKKSFVLYADAYECIRTLAVAEKGELLDAIYMYQLGEAVGKLSPAVGMAFNFIRAQFERDNQKYAQRCEKNRENAKMRWDANACKRMRSNAKHADTDTDTDTDTDIKLDTTPSANAPVDVTALPTGIELSEDMSAVVRDWLVYKKSKGQKYKSDKSKVAMIKLLLKLSNNDPLVAMAIVEQSMANNWNGLYALKRITDGQTVVQKPSQNHMAEFMNSLQE